MGFDKNTMTEKKGGGQKGGGQKGRGGPGAKMLRFFFPSPNPLFVFFFSSISEVFR